MLIASACRSLAARLSTNPQAWEMLTSTAARAMSTEVSRSLHFDNFGTPESVLRLEETSLAHPPALADDEVLINILAAPINPSDINVIEGKYPLRPDLPGIPGFEGVGSVIAIGSNVSRMKPGDRVVPIEHCQGTWRSHGVFKEQYWHKVPKDLPIAVSATMVINPPTALRMLEEYQHLTEGDTIIQSGATSATGKYVIQLAKSKHVNTINVIRHRANRHQVERELKDLGGSIVVTEDELPRALKESGLPPPKLALDCIGGDVATAMAKTLQPGGTMVVYGGMSKRPVCIPGGLFIFNGISVKGFWLTGGYAKMKDGYIAKEKLVDRVVALFRTKVLRPVMVDCVPLQDWEQAFDRYRQAQKDCKILLTNYPEDACLH